MGSIQMLMGSIKEGFYEQWPLLETFYHELTHAKQLLTGELVVRPRSRVWKGQRWGTKEYSFAPWEEEARREATRLREGFKRTEVIQQMRQPDANGYVVAHSLKLLLPVDEVFAITQQCLPLPAETP